MNEDWNKVDDLRGRYHGWVIYDDGQFGQLYSRGRTAAHEEFLAQIAAEAAAGEVFYQRALAEALRRRMTK